MKRRRLSSQRRRAGTFTFIVLAVSVLILTTATVLVDAIRATHRRGAEQAAQVRLREAAFAGVAWAKRAHAEKDARQAGKLQLQAVTVEVTYKQEGGAVRVTSIAKAPRQWVRIDAVLKPKQGGALDIDTFELHLSDPKTAKATAKTAKTDKTDQKTRKPVRRDF